METFALKIVTPDGSAFDGVAKKLFCRTINGDVGILPRHSDYCTALGMGSAHVVFEDDKVRYAACIGGMLSVLGGKVNLVATTWEWAEDIDKNRAAASQARAEKVLAHTSAENEQDRREYELAQARLKRALVRQSIAK